jgi:hypothetical protein
MEKELGEGHLSSTAFDRYVNYCVSVYALRPLGQHICSLFLKQYLNRRYCMILFAGIAAEALVYGEAEGGENDENLFRSLCILLNPPLSVAQVHFVLINLLSAC